MSDTGGREPEALHYSDGFALEELRNEPPNDIRPMSPPAPQRLPEFIGVGPLRTSAIWLDTVLRGRVGLPSGIKATDFFSFNYHLGIEWYRSHFRDCDPSLPAIEFSPAYFDWPEVPERIATHIPR